VATSKENLEDQLSITQKMNSVIERMAMTMTRIEQSYANQSQYIEKITEALNALDVKKANAEIATLTARVKGLADSLGDIASTSADAMGKAAKGASVADDSVKAFNDRIKDSSKNLKNAGTAGSNFDQISEMIDNAKKSGKGFNDNMSGLEKFFRGKFPKAIFIAAAAISGFKQGFDNVVAVSKSFIGVLTELSSTVFNVGLAIASIPLKIFTGLVDLAASASANWGEFAQAIEDLRKEFGDLKGPTSLALTGLSRDLKGFSDTGLSAWRVFGDVAQRLTFLKENAEAMGATFDSTRKEWEDNGGALLGFQKGLGLTADTMKSLAQRAISVGKPMSKFLLDTTKQTLALGDAFGISQKVIGKDMGKAFDDMKHFAQLSVKEIGQASVYARKLGLELDKITGTLDQFETFDSAAESAAKLTQSFGITIDAFKLMEAQSPAEQMDMLKKSFARAGVDVANFNRQQLHLLASTTGLDEATAKQAFSLKNQGVELDQIKKKSDVAEKKQLTQAEAMGKLADSIERMVKLQDQTGSYFDMFVKGVSRGFQSSKDFIKIISNIKNGLQQVYYVGVDLGRQLPKIMPGLGKFLSGLREFFDPKKFRAVAQSVSDAIKDYFTGQKGLTEALAGIKDQFMKFFNAQGPVAMKIYDGFKDIFKFVVKIVNDSIPLLAKSIAKTLSTLTEFIHDPKAFMKNIKGQGQEFGFFTDLVMQTAGSLKDAGSVIWPALKGLLIVLFDKLKQAVQEPPISTALISAGKVAVAMMFGPAIARAGLAAFTSFIVKTTLESFASSAAVKAGTSAAMGYLGKIFGSGGSAGASAVSNAVSGGLSKASTAAGSLFAKMASVPLIASAATMANSFALKLGASGVGNVLGGAVGLAAVAYIGMKGKEIIDESFKKSADAQNHGAIALAQSGGKNKSVNALQGQADAIKSAIKELKESQEGVSGFTQDLLGGVATLVSDAPNMRAQNNAQIGDLEEELHRINDRMEQAKKITLENKSTATKAVVSADSFISPTTLDEAKSKIIDLESLGKKLTSKDFDLQKTIDGIKAKFANISFDIVSPEQGVALSKSIETFGTVTDSIKNAASSMNVFKGFASELNGAVKEIKQAGLAPALKAIQEMIDQVNKMDEALSDGRLNTINVKTKLQQVAANVGLGSKAQYTIQTKPVNITVNLQVSMNAEDMEKALIMRASSIIRDRLNFATERPSDRGASTISDKVGEQIGINSSSSS